MAVLIFMEKRMKKLRVLSFVIGFVVLISGVSFAENKKDETKIADNKQNSMQEAKKDKENKIITRQIKRKNNYKKDSDDNLLLITINYNGDDYSQNTEYLAVVFIDNIAVEDFRNQKLPLTINRNYAGLSKGVHQLKIEIEDGHGKLLSSETMELETK